MTKQRLAAITLVVDDYDRAIRFYTEVMGFRLLEDRVLSAEKRWVRVAPPGGDGCCLLLARAWMRSSAAGSATRPGAGFSCFCIPIILRAITTGSVSGVYSSCANRYGKNTAPLPFLRTCTAIFGI
jgi:hypothetical protein